MNTRRVSKSSAPSDCKKRIDFAERARLPVALLAALLAVQSVPAAEPKAVGEGQVDSLFSSRSASTPGCAVGVAQDGRIVLEKAYGMADLEHDVPNRPDTIFEAGSVSKQFTAAAVLLLAQDGKLELDEPVRKYLPELPEHAATITIRQMLQHTSGLRDWGSIESIAGWPRGTRVYTHAHVLDILGRQQALNFAPGTRWSYSNSGYNLAVILVSRVAGESFAEFTRKRIFEPLGMTRTSWRDDYTRVVKGRAIAYAAAGAGYAADMPFENVHGNGGLLTTVGDLLRWSGNFDDPKVGGRDFVRELQTPGRLANGNGHGYALGLAVGQYKGLSVVRHSGTTASYRAYLARYPEQRVSVAVLCNAGDSSPREVTQAVADLYVADALRPDPEPLPARLTDAELDAIAGLYRNVERGDVMQIERDGDALRLGDGTPLTILASNQLTDGDGTTIELAGAGRAAMDEGDGTLLILERVASAQPTLGALETLAGTYASEEADTTLVVCVREGKLELARRPDAILPLTPLYADAFESEIGTVIFRRDGAGRPVEFSVVQERIWDLRFRRETASSAHRVLVFGDSNTWGWIPVERGFPTARYDADRRWPGVAQAALGHDYEIVEEGLSGRTTDLADASVQEVPGAGIDGSAYLPAAIASHLPLDLVVIMLGSNDLKTAYDRSPEEVALGLRRLIERIQSMDRSVWTEYPAPKVLVVAPPPFVATARFPGAVFAGGIEKSRQLARHFETVADATGAEFLDAGTITSADGVDGLHLTEAAHRRLGLAIAGKIGQILE
jgi:CubicO group peptidase (beta-lactamase class C family)/lysophospholipase L1-like esterase